jgi:heat shock protein HslJ
VLALGVLFGALLAVAACSASDSLAGPTWQWTGSNVTGQASPVVAPDPAAYTIRFGSDGVVTVTAGCSDVDGRYAIGIPVDLTISLDPAPTAACATTLDATYLELLSDVSAYSTGGGTLTLELIDDGGSLQFKPAGR